MQRAMLSSDTFDQLVFRDDLTQSRNQSAQNGKLFGCQRHVLVATKQTLVKDQSVWAELVTGWIGNNHGR
jgi:hypothetical protein